MRACVRAEAREGRDHRLGRRSKVRPLRSGGPVAQGRILRRSSRVSLARGEEEEGGARQRGADGSEERSGDGSRSEWTVIARLHSFYMTGHE